MQGEVVTSIDGIPTEISNFEVCEEDHNSAFTGWKRMPCFINTLQLVVKIFQDTPYNLAKSKARSIVMKVNKSCKATEHLVELAGKKLTKNCRTRWDSMF